MLIFIKAILNNIDFIYANIENISLVDMFVSNIFALPKQMDLNKLIII